MATSQATQYSVAGRPSTRVRVIRVMTMLASLAVIVAALLLMLLSAR
ncbi:hypothetical protein [Williamsia sterculiae]|uniref:Uncharacterized protein n=1 Tax=Williamsia sterculiae TaxID=1344003 RepID=A0A1N7GXY4_9NOCA|nr:hypothetical protein [Williamsia sterculiae]SIS17390.1 hypothetical protein SAMN05445060_3253 [Williamsia sterculiae]